MGSEGLWGLVLLLAGFCVREAASGISVVSVTSATHTGNGDASRGAVYGIEDNTEGGTHGFWNRGLLQVNKSEDVNYTLWMAASQGNETVVMWALENNASIDTRHGSFNNTPLLAASREGFHAIVSLLLNNTYAIADVNATDKDNASSLFISSQYGHTDVVKELLAKNASVDAPRAMYDDTPLFIASQNGHLNVVRELLIAGANVNRHDNESNTPLHVASENGHLGVVQVLLENAADPNLKNRYGNTPLHYACVVLGDSGQGVVNITAVSAENVDVAANDNSTPLIWASWFGNPNTVELLLNEFNASKELTNNRGRNAFDQICGCLEDEDKEGVIKCPEGGCQASYNESTIPRLQELLAV